VAAAWTETGLTWGSQPATTGPTATASTGGGGWVTWTVTAQVADMYAAGNYGLRIKDTVEDTAATSTNKYSSQEGSDPPELIVQWGSNASRTFVQTAKRRAPGTRQRGQRSHV
jgi:hypothetical protein